MFWWRKRTTCVSVRFSLVQSGSVWFSSVQFDSVQTSYFRTRYSNLRFHYLVPKLASCTKFFLSRVLLFVPNGILCLPPPLLSSSEATPPHHDHHKTAISTTKSRATYQSTFTVAFFVYLGLCWCVFLVGCSVWSCGNNLFKMKNNHHQTTVDGRQLMPFSTIKRPSNQQSNVIIISIGI